MLIERDRRRRLPPAVINTVRTMVRAGATAQQVVLYIGNQARHYGVYYIGLYEIFSYIYYALSSIYGHPLVQHWLNERSKSIQSAPPTHPQLMDVDQDDPGPKDLVPYQERSNWVVTEGHGKDRPGDLVPLDPFDVYKPFKSYKRRKTRNTPSTEPPSTSRPPSNAPSSEAPSPTPTPTVTESAHSGNLNQVAAMSHYTSFPLTRCCVDLGAFKPNMKKDFVDPETIADTKSFKYQVQGFMNSVQGNFSFLPLLDSKTSQTSGAGTPQMAVTWNQDPFPGLNSVRQLEAVFSSFSLTNPTTRADQDALIDEPGDANQLVLLANQYIECYIKNINYTAGSGHESPAFVRLYLAQAKNDIYDLIPSSTTNENVGEQIRSGWETAYTNFAGGLTGDIDMFYRIGENPWFLENFKIIDAKKFCLAPGQEGVFRCMLRPPQILSFQHKLRARYRTADYTEPVVCKKGEMMFFYQLHGGVASYDTRAKVNIAPCKIAFVVFSSWNASLYGSNKNVTTCTEVSEVTDGTTEDTVIDVHSNP